MKHRVTHSIRLSVALLTGLMVACISFLIVEFITLVSVRQSASDEAEFREWIVDRATNDMKESMQRELDNLARRVTSLTQSTEFTSYLLQGENPVWFSSHIIPGIAENHPDIVGALVLDVRHSKDAQYGALPPTLVDEKKRAEIFSRVLDGELLSGIEFLEGKAVLVSVAPVSTLAQANEVAGALAVVQEISPRWIAQISNRLNAKIEVLSRQHLAGQYDRERSDAEMRVFSVRGNQIDLKVLIEGVTREGSGVIRATVDSTVQGLFEIGVGRKLLSFLPRALTVSLLLGLLVGTVIYISVTIPLQRMLRAQGARSKVRGHGIEELDAVERILHSEQSVRMGRERVGDTLLANIREGFQLISSTGETLDVNPALCALVGASRDKFDPSSAPFWYLDEEGRAVAQDFIQVLSSDDFIARAGFDALIRRPDGTERPVGVRLSVVEVGESERCIAVLVIDRAEERAQQVETAKHEQARILGEFAAGLAHNMNNLLTGIIGAVSVLQSPLRKPNPAIETKLFSSIRSAALQGAALTKELLQISRSTQVHTTRSAVDVCKVVQEAILIVEGMEAARGFAFRRSIPEVAILALCESAGLHQVIINLLSNAIDAMDSPGVIELAVRPGVGPHAGTVEIEVADHGSGMTEEVRMKVFEPFFTTKAVPAAAGRKRLGGTGLGLSSSLALTESWGGHMACTSVEGKGSSFFVRLVAADRMGESPSDSPSTEFRRSSGAWMGS